MRITIRVVCPRGSKIERVPLSNLALMLEILHVLLALGIMFWFWLSESLLCFCFLKVFNKMAGFAYLLIEFFCLGNMQILNPAAHCDKELANNLSYMLYFFLKAFLFFYKDRTIYTKLSLLETGFKTAFY